MECLTRSSGTNILGVCAPGDVVGLAAAACGSSLLRSWSCSQELSRGRCSRHKGDFKVTLNDHESPCMLLKQTIWFSRL